MDGGIEPSAKVVWSTDADFDRLGWHEVKVHAIAQTNDDDRRDLLFDIDYLVRWLEPEPPRRNIRFQIAPATLIFVNVVDLDGEIGSWYGDIMVIDRIHRNEPEGERARSLGFVKWTIVDLNRGELSFLATSFRLHLRTRPFESKRIWLSTEERGGISFAQPSRFPEP